MAKKITGEQPEYYETITAKCDSVTSNKGGSSVRLIVNEATAEVNGQQARVADTVIAIQYRDPKKAVAYEVGAVYRVIVEKELA